MSLLTLNKCIAHILFDFRFILCVSVCVCDTEAIAAREINTHISRNVGIKLYFEASRKLRVKHCMQYAWLQLPSCMYVL